MTTAQTEKLEIGEAWGFADQCEATVYPMTPEEYDRWHSPWMCTPAVQWFMNFGDQTEADWVDSLDGNDLDNENLSNR